MVEVEGVGGERWGIWREGGGVGEGGGGGLGGEGGGDRRGGKGGGVDGGGGRGRGGGSGGVPSPTNLPSLRTWSGGGGKPPDYRMGLEESASFQLALQKGSGAQMWLQDLISSLVLKSSRDLECRLMCTCESSWSATSTAAGCSS